MFWAIGGAWNSGSGDYAHGIFRQGSTVNDASADVNMGSRCTDNIRVIISGIL